MNMLIAGYFDYAVLAVLIVLNIKFWKKEVKQSIGCLVGGILFGIVLPIISQFIEVKRVQHSIGIMDNFEVLYTMFRFPLYWLLGILQLLIFGIKKKSDSGEAK